MGVVHRDVKPSNLLIDAQGHLWITDFGLAMTQPDAGLTMTGDLLGTLRYMSPEQAAGKRLPLDHRTDIYSLGITLYELLAGRPAFDTSERGELLRAIAEVDPPSLRKLAPAITVDMETIVHKAIQKDAADRYASAGDLAADLRSFLNHTPIRAKAPSVASRIRKWTKRNTAAVAAGVGVLLLTVIGLSLGAVMLNAQKNEAVANLWLAAEAVDRLLAEMGREASVYGQLPQAERILDQAGQFYEHIIEKSNDPAVLRRAATAHNHMGSLYRGLGRHELAIQKHEAALALLDRIDAQQNQADILETRAKAYDGIGTAHAGTLYAQPAEPSFVKAQTVWQQLVDGNPGNVHYVDELMGTLNSLAVVYMNTERLAEAEEAYQHILELSEKLPAERLETADQLNTMAGLRCNLGTLAVERGRLAVAEPLFRESVANQEKVVSLQPGVQNHEHDLYSFQWNLADVLFREEKHAEASAAAKALVERFPKLLQAHYEAADLLLRCAEHAEQLENATADPALSDTAERYHEAARQLIDSANSADKRTPDSLGYFAWFLVTWKDLSFRDPARALALAEAAILEAPRRPFLHRMRGIALYRLGNYQDAIEALDKSAELNSGADIFDALFLAMAHGRLGNEDEAKQWYTSGVEWIEKRKLERRSVYDFLAAAQGRILAEAKEVLGR